ncbi:MAG: FecR family protein [Chitinophagaceae bacterium]|nr:FecR family protein [Chitinophagaceae bacterium]
MDDNRFLLLVTRKLAGEATVEELTELAVLLRTEPLLKEEHDTLLKYWQQENQQQTASTEAALQKVLSQINIDETISETETVRSIRPGVIAFRIAAAIALLFALAVVGYQFFNKKDGENSIDGLVQKLNAKGVKSTIALADGSKVWLNADSKIQYPARFTGNTREVFLNGEAFFDIEKNPEKPFIIHLTNGTIRVLGTSFNVKAYDGETIVETSVATGKVAFIPQTPQ